MNEIISFINMIDDDFLLSLANMGYLKKARKEFDSNNFSKISDSPLVIELKTDSETNKVTFLEAKADKIVCTCPDSKFCKHRMMAIFYVQKESLEFSEKNIVEKKDEDEAKKELQKILSDLIQFDESQLEKYFTKALFEKGIRYFIELKESISYEIKPNGVTFTIQDEKRGETISTTFLKISPKDNVICSCKPKKGTKCIHQIAIFLYLAVMFEKISLDSLMIKVEEELATIDESVLKEIEKIIYEIMKFGLSKTTPITLQRLRRAGFKLHYDSPLIERSLYNLEEELSLFISRDNKFSPTKFNSLLFKPLRLIRLYRSNSTDVKLVKSLTEHRSDYYDVAKITLFGVGHEYLEFANGGVAVKLYFLNEQNRVYTRSVYRTVYDGNTGSTKHLLLKSGIWGEVNEAGIGEFAIEGFNGFKFTLSQTKSNDENSLSSKGKIIMEYRHKFEPFNVYKEFSQLKKDFIEFRRDNFLLQTYSKVFYSSIKVSAHGEPQFNYENQYWEIPLFDEKNSHILMRLYASKFDSPEAQKSFLESVAKVFTDYESEKPDIYFGKLFIDDGVPIFYPISSYYSEKDTILSTQLQGFVMPPEKTKGKKKGK